MIVGCKNNVALWNSQGTGDPIENVVVEHNTLVNAKTNDSKNAHAISVGTGNFSNVTIHHNIIYQQDSKAKLASKGGNASFHTNLWSRTPPSNVSGRGDIVADPRLQNPNAQLKPLQVKVDWYKLQAQSPRQSSKDWSL